MSFVRFKIGLFNFFNIRMKEKGFQKQSDTGWIDGNKLRHEKNL
jgi:hypothetical protein